MPSDGHKEVDFAVNKMDLVSYDQNTFTGICNDFFDMSGELGFDEVTPIALSALNGDNVTERSRKMVWFNGPTLMSKLETVEVDSGEKSSDFIFPVQSVNRPNSEFRGYDGEVVQGVVNVGDQCRIWPSGATTEVKRLWIGQQIVEKASSGLNITIELEHDVNISRGSVVSSISSPVQSADQFEADVVWLSHEHGYPGRTYLMKAGGQSVNATFLAIKYEIDINSGQQLGATKMTLNQVSRVQLNLQSPICFSDYLKCKKLGSFIFIDPLTKETVAAGMIRFALRRSTNIHPHHLEIDKHARRLLNGHTSKVYWFTGLSGSGKSTIANKFATHLHANGFRCYVLDGDNIRHGLNRDLGFSDADRIENIRRIAEVGKLLVDAGIVVLTAFISPFQAEREMARSLFDEGEFIEVFIDTPIEVCEERDVKGLYKKARVGDLPNFTGIDSPFETPVKPDVVLKTDSDNLNDNVMKLMGML